MRFYCRKRPARCGRERRGREKRAAGRDGGKRGRCGAAGKEEMNTKFKQLKKKERAGRGENIAKTGRREGRKKIRQTGQTAERTEKQIKF